MESIEHTNKPVPQRRGRCRAEVCAQPQSGKNKSHTQGAEHSPSLSSPGKCLQGLPRQKRVEKTFASEMGLSSNCHTCSRYSQQQRQPPQQHLTQVTQQEGPKPLPGADLGQAIPGSRLQLLQEQAQHRGASSTEGHTVGPLGLPSAQICSRGGTGHMENTARKTQPG